MGYDISYFRVNNSSYAEKKSRAGEPLVTLKGGKNATSQKSDWWAEGVRKEGSSRRRTGERGHTRSIV